jgi:hypothetical protein
MAERERPMAWEDWKWLHRWPRLTSIEWALEWLVYWCRGLAFFEVLEFADRASVLVRVSTLSDTVGESFELNIIAAQEAGTLTGTVRPIAIDQGSVPGKLNFGHLRTS